MDRAGREGGKKGTKKRSQKKALLCSAIFVVVVRLATGRSRNLLSGLTRDRYGRGASLLPAFSGPADLIAVGQVLRVLIFCAAFLPFPSSVVSPPPVFAAISECGGGFHS